MTISEVWVGYCGLGGNGSKHQVAAWLAGRAAVPATDFDLLVQTVNDCAADSGITFPARYLDGS